MSFTYTPDGRRQTAVDARGTTSYAYDFRRRLVQETYPDSRVLRFGYDAHGDRTSLTATIGGTPLTTTTTYDADNRPSGVTDPLGRNFILSYDAASNRTGIRYPDITSTAYGYDALNRLTSLATTQGSSSPVTVQSYAYALDAAGKRTKITEADGTVRAYGYDGIDRLTSETVSGSLSYAKVFTYDPVGNRQTQITNGGAAGADGGASSADGGFDASSSGASGGSTSNYSYDSRDRLTTETSAATPTTYAYDSNGNLTSKAGEASYSWDFENRLTGATMSAGAVVAHGYDADGNRVQTSVTPSGAPAATTNMLVDTSGGLSQVVAETDGSGNISAYYVRVGDELLAVMRPGATAGTWSTRFVHSDGLGSVRVLTDETGTTIDQRSYEAFGTKNVEAGSDPLAYGFAGEPFEPASKLAYHRARWMDARVGRFEGMDPVDSIEQAPGKYHSYVYGQNDPVTLRDPTGGEADIGTELGVVTGFSVESLVAGVSYAAKAAAIVCGAEEVASFLSPANIVPQGLCRNRWFNHYTNLNGYIGITAKGQILPDSTGEVYFTSDYYFSGAVAKDRLALWSPLPPVGFFRVPEVTLVNPVHTLPAYPNRDSAGVYQHGGGDQWISQGPVSTALAVWIPIGP